MDIPIRNWPVPQYWMPTPSQESAVTGGIPLKSDSGTTPGTPRLGSVTPLSGPLAFVAITPCRMVDTRAFAGMPAPFGVPALSSYVTRSFPLKNHPTCVIPPEAKAYSLNLVAIPQGPLSFLSAWPGGYPFPVTSFLNSYTGDIVNNAVIIAAGVNGAINVVAGNPTDLLIDINGYFIDMPQAKNSLGGVVSSSGSPQNLPAGWSSTRNGTGQYVITFPAGTFPASSNPAPVLSPIGAVATLQGASIVRLADGSGTLTVNWSNDVTFSFVVAAN
ncbi:MAG: hypothetical protein NZR01_02305 [Bryobacteraceae bacterium]|nr:hypothetical protein [Bryobacteraceae bacterium]